MTGKTGQEHVGGRPERPLEGWKEIAAHLGRSVRTARRWDQEEGLPVHRQPHKQRPSVYAFPRELEEWRAGKRPAEVEHAQSGWLRPVLAFASTIALAVVLLTAGSAPQVGASGATTGAENQPHFAPVSVETAMSTGHGGKLSPDGKRFAFVADGSVWVAPVHADEEPYRTGTPVRLTEPMGAWTVGGTGITWSQDGEWIAFLRSDGDAGVSDEQIYIVPSGGGEPRHVVSHGQLPQSHSHRIALSPHGLTLYFVDGEQSLGKIAEIDELRILAVPTSGGATSAVTAAVTREPAVSPDGTKMVYVRLERTPEGRWDSRQIWVKRLDGGKPALVSEALTESCILNSPIWSPEGSKIALLADCGSGDDRVEEIWIVPISSDGSPAGPAEKHPLPVVHPEIAAANKVTAGMLAGWTNDGRIGLNVRGGGQHIGLYTISSSGGEALQINTGPAFIPRWSPDGETVYYRGGTSFAISAVSADGGSDEGLSLDREMVVSIPGGGVAVSPDGSTICFAGVYGEQSGAAAPTIFTVSSSGGTPNRLTFPVAGVRADLSPTWSPDGRQIAFMRVFGVSSSLYTIPAKGGEPQPIMEDGEPVQGAFPNWSPDGAHLAYFGADSTLRAVPAAGGTSRVLVSDLGNIRQQGLTWSPDGSAIAYTARGRVWKIGRAGGEPVEIPTGLQASPQQIDWSPDGKRLVFNVYSGSRGAELWLMEGRF